MIFDLDAVRAEFPALSLTDDGRPRCYFDNPAGTQVPRRVIDAVADCLLARNANIGGSFTTSRHAGSIVEAARLAMRDLLNAPRPDEIVFGQNMTSLTLHLSRSIGRMLRAGDEIILSRMDHDANVQPWLLMARDHGLEVRWLAFDRERFEFDLQDLDDLLSDRTRLVCIGGASNLTGTINDVAGVCRRARAVGAWTYIDAVQSVPHVVTDVQALGCDFLVCSAYKFFGTHQGVLWGRSELMSRLQPYKVRPAPDELPETMATQAVAGEAGGRRRAIVAGMRGVYDYEQMLSARLVDGLKALPGVRVQGLSDRDALARRVPTVSFTHERVQPDALAEQLGERNFYVWSGHNYAVEAARTLGVHDSGGVLRVGPVHYNSTAEIDAFLDALEDLLPGAARKMTRAVKIAARK
jgi:selenocysteine lyase/cysteine desulfurase